MVDVDHTVRQVTDYGIRRELLGGSFEKRTNQINGKVLSPGERSRYQLVARAGDCRWLHPRLKEVRHDLVVALLADDHLTRLDDDRITRLVGEHPLPLNQIECVRFEEFESLLHGRALAKDQIFEPTIIDLLSACEV